MTKKWTTIGYLPLRSTIFPLTGLLILLGLVEGAVLPWLWRKSPSLTLERLFDWPTTLIFLGALILTGVLLAVRCAGGDATLERLDLSPTGRFFLWGGWGALCFFILMAWQVLVFLLLGTVYFSLNPTLAHPQAMMLAAYRSELIYALLPLWEVRRRSVGPPPGAEAVAYRPLPLPGAGAVQLHRRARQHDSLRLRPHPPGPGGLVSGDLEGGVP